MHTKGVSTAVVVVCKPINGFVNLQITGQVGQAGHDQEVMISNQDMSPGLREEHVGCSDLNREKVSSTHSFFFISSAPRVFIRALCFFFIGM